MLRIRPQRRDTSEAVRRALRLNSVAPRTASKQPLRYPHRNCLVVHKSLKMHHCTGSITVIRIDSVSIARNRTLSIQGDGTRSCGYIFAPVARTRGTGRGRLHGLAWNETQIRNNDKQNLRKNSIKPPGWAAETGNS